MSLGHWGINDTAHRTAMAWDEWAPRIKGGCPVDRDAGVVHCSGRYTIPEAGAFLDYHHYDHLGRDHIAIGGIYTHPEDRNGGVAEALVRRLSEDHPGVPIKPGTMTRDGRGFHDRMLDKEPSARSVLAMAWDTWAPRIKGGCDNGCDHDRYLMGEYSIDHTDGTGPQPSDLMPGIKGRSLLQFTHDTDQHGNPEIYVSGIHVDENHRRDGVAEALMRRLHQDHPDTPINPGFMTDMGEGLLDGLKKRVPGAGDALVPRHAAAHRQAAKPRGGDCYQAAGRYILDNPTADVHLVHADVTGRGPMEGVRMGHAWVEDGDDVIDNANGGAVRLPRAIYHALGDVRNAVRYTPAEAMAMMAEHEHFGPWHGTDAAHNNDDHREAALRTAMGWRGNVPDDLEFRHVHNPNGVDYMGQDVLTAHTPEGREVGQLYWFPSGEISWISVVGDHTGRDIGRAMVDHAIANHNPEIHHSSELTSSGRRWMEQNPIPSRTAMPAPPPRGMTFHYYPDGDALQAAGRSRGDQPLYPPCVEARNAQGNHVGFLEWHGDEMPHLPPGEINMVKVKPGYRRRGVATALLDFARQHDPGVHHSSGKTELGQMWADHEESRYREAARRQAAWDPHDAQEQAARDVMHLHHYIKEGEHPDGTGTVLLHPRAHHPALTNHWAAEIIRPNPYGPRFGRRAQAATGNYVNALTGVVEGTYTAPELENARNGLRVELQHARHFDVPDLSEFSRLPRSSDAMRLAAVNPRHNHGMEVPSMPRPGGSMAGKLRWLDGANARLAAYMINCQRACLALDARHRGLNVEARPNYHNPRHDPGGTDEQWSDDELADLWHDRDGNQPAWIDASDHFQLATPGTAHWDAMTDHINSWGRGARALIAMTQANPTDPTNGDPFRHVIMARVGRDGKVRYVDPQIARADASDWRGRVMYGGHPLLFTAADRAHAASLTDDHRVKNVVRNRLYSPLRYLRTDDAELSPHAALHLVDRGTAGPAPITPAAPALPDLPDAPPTPPSNPARDW